MQKIILAVFKIGIKEIGISNLIIVAFFGLYVYQQKLVLNFFIESQKEILLTQKELNSGCNELTKKIDEVILRSKDNTILQNSTQDKINDIEKEIVIIKSIYRERKK